MRDGSEDVLPRARAITSREMFFVANTSSRPNAQFDGPTEFCDARNALMEIKKAVITAAGQNQRTLPLQSLVDRDGQSKTALRIIIEEVLEAGIDEIAVVIRPGDQKAYETAAGSHATRLQFVEQTKPLGYGHAVHCAKPFTGRSPFLLLVGDHLYVSRNAKRCASQLVETAREQNCAVSAVQATHESKLPYYGAIGGRLAPGSQTLYEISDVLEKPTPTEAEQRIIVPGLRAGHYLCFFGMHVLTPAVMDLLEAQLEKKANGVHLTPALAQLTTHERYLAYEVAGRRYDIGHRYGLLTAQLALALDGPHRDEVLTGLVELLAVKGTK
jgi:UTP--glucose-1-phosphate uridylyltransferase